MRTSCVLGSQHPEVGLPLPRRWPHALLVLRQREEVPLIGGCVPPSPSPPLPPYPPSILPPRFPPSLSPAADWRPPRLDHVGRAGGLQAPSTLTPLPPPSPCCPGWTMSDALGVFRQIDVNCNGDITLEEFQAWWEVRGQA